MLIPVFGQTGFLFLTTGFKLVFTFTDLQRMS